MLVSLYDQTVEVKRLEDGAGNTQEFGVHIASLACHIQPLDESIAQDLAPSGGFGKAWLLVCATADIDESDRIVWSGDEYKVSGIVRYSFLGSSHMEITMRKFES